MIRRSLSALLALAAAVLAPAAPAHAVAIDFGNVLLGATVQADIPFSVAAGYQVTFAVPNGAMSPPFDFDFGDCLGAGGALATTCTAREFFSPSVYGAASASLNMFQCPLSAGDCLPTEYSFTGTAISLLQQSGGTIDFGDVLLGSTLSLDIPLPVDAGYRITFVPGGDALNPPFAFDFGTCLGAGGAQPSACVAQESFSPLAPGPATAELKIYECPIVEGSDCVPATFTLTANGVAEVAAVPEPASLALLAPALLGLAARRRHR